MKTAQKVRGSPPCPVRRVVSTHYNTRTSILKNQYQWWFITKHLIVIIHVRIFEDPSLSRGSFWGFAALIKDMHSELSAAPSCTNFASNVGMGVGLVKAAEVITYYLSLFNYVPHEVGGLYVFNFVEATGSFTLIRHHFTKSIHTSPKLTLG